jgi:hypothetical protein
MFGLWAVSQIGGSPNLTSLGIWHTIRTHRIQNKCCSNFRIAAHALRISSVNSGIISFQWYPWNSGSNSKI